MDHEEALHVAKEFLEASRRPSEPELQIDHGRVREKEGVLIVPYNSSQYLKTRRASDMLLDCWPMLVELDSGSIRFGELEERMFWKE